MDTCNRHKHDRLYANGSCGKSRPYGDDGNAGQYHGHPHTRLAEHAGHGEHKRRLGLEGATRSLLAKPFTSLELARRVRTILDGTA